MCLHLPTSLSSDKAQLTPFIKYHQPRPAFTMEGAAHGSLAFDMMFVTVCMLASLGAWGIISTLWKFAGWSLRKKFWGKDDVTGKNLPATVRALKEEIEQLQHSLHQAQLKALRLQSKLDQHQMLENIVIAPKAGMKYHASSACPSLSRSHRVSYGACSVCVKLPPPETVEAH